MFPKSKNTLLGTLFPITRSWKWQIGFQIQMSPESNNSHAVLGRGRLVFRSKCPPNGLNTPQRTLWLLARFLEVVFFQFQMFPESVKHATGNIVASYAILGSGLFLRSKCSSNLLNTPQGTLLTRMHNPLRC